MGRSEVGYNIDYLINFSFILQFVMRSKMQSGDLVSALFSVLVIFS